MTRDAAFQLILNNPPDIIYISGKTSTGKSTLANQLAAELDYIIIELDEVVLSIIKKLNIDKEELAFIEIYRGRKQLEWIGQFVDSTQQEIDKWIKQGKKVILEGSIAQSETLKEIVGKYQQFTFIYIHPAHLEPYVHKLTKRFLQSTPLYNAGLPKRFWEKIDENDFEQYCKDHKLTSSINNSIRKYAQSSQLESKQRLDILLEIFEDILVVET